MAGLEVLQRNKELVKKIGEVEVSDLFLYGSDEVPYRGQCVRENGWYKRYELEIISNKSQRFEQNRVVVVFVIACYYLWYKLIVAFTMLPLTHSKLDI